MRSSCCCCRTPHGRRGTTTTTTSHIFHSARFSKSDVIGFGIYYFAGEDPPRSDLRLLCSESRNRRVAFHALFWRETAAESEHVARVLSRIEVSMSIRAWTRLLFYLWDTVIITCNYRSTLGLRFSCSLCGRFVVGHWNYANCVLKCHLLFYMQSSIAFYREEILLLDLV
ncbi:hypothetical protein CDAR_309821 [Caerostris darwini]|uniref:Uncharacterized protein n=1 Tax=Caerostris darwini TaxID=1538125 RepID=A0AAV4VYJ5_9ARAC|nr:hypothetical protein CDAR_309821 [Caerostris darwini]